MGVAILNEVSKHRTSQVEFLEKEIHDTEARKHMLELLQVNTEGPAHSRAVKRYEQLLFKLKTLRALIRRSAFCVDRCRTAMCDAVSCPARFQRKEAFELY